MAHQPSPPSLLVLLHLDHHLREVHFDILLQVLHPDRLHRCRENLLHKTTGTSPRHINKARKDRGGRTGTTRPRGPSLEGVGVAVVVDEEVVDAAGGGANREVLV